MDPASCNYNALANVDDGNCSYPPSYRDCNGNCIEYHVLYADTEGQQEFLSGVCKDIALGLYCGDPSACNYYEVFYPDDDSVEPYHNYSSDPVYDVNGNLLFGGCEYDSCAGLNNYVIETLDDYVNILGLNFLDLAYLAEYANTVEFFPEFSKFDATNNGDVGTPDMLSFLSFYGLIVYNNTDELNENEIGYNAKEIAISGEYNLLSDFLSEFGYDGIEFIQDSNNLSIPSSNSVNPNTSEYDRIKYNAIKLLHIIASTNVTKGELKEKLNQAFVGAGAKEYASRMILCPDENSENGSIYSDKLLSINTNLFLAFLSAYGNSVAMDSVDYNQQVFS
jgi:hypothetical protein